MMSRRPNIETMSLRSCRCREKVVEEPNRVLDKKAEGEKGIIHNLALSAGSLPKRYIDGWVEIHVRIGFRDAGDYCAIFYLPGMDEHFANCPHGQGGAEEPSACGSLCEMQVSVFVHVTQFIDPEKLLPPVAMRTKARLFRLYDCFCSRAHPLDFPLGAGARPCTGTLANRESGTSTRCPPINDDELPREVVKGRPEIVDRVADDSAQDHGRLAGVALDFPRLVSALRVALYLDGVRFGVTKAPDEPICFMHVLTTTPYFEPHAIQRVHGLYPHYGSVLELFGRRFDGFAP